MPPLQGALRRLFLWPNLFKNKKEANEQKASATAPLISLQLQGQPQWTPRDYTSLADEGYMQNAIVYRCVRMISEAAASVPLLLSDGRQELDNHPLLDLLRRPNQIQSGTDLLESWYGHLLVAGNAYMEAVTVGGKLRELYSLRPDRMKIIAGKQGWPEAYEYTVNGQTVRFRQMSDQKVHPILHLALFHPTNDHYGFSPIEAAAVGIDIHNAAGSWNKALFDNSARPSGALVYQNQDGNLSQEQFERLKSELENNFQGSQNAGRPLLLEGGLDWKSMSLSPRDMDFIDAKHIAAREIALAFGVPPMLLGIPGDNTYANYAEANRTLWRQTILPLVNRSLKHLATWLSPLYEQELYIRVDLDQIEALSCEREILWDRVQNADFLTINEKRAAVGYAPLEGDGERLSQISS